MNPESRNGNGADSLVKTLVANGVDVCFTNPGTSEMHFVSALDRIDGMRCVLGLFEGVVAGAADGYYRIADKPASTLLHLGPGLANGLANLHNAKKAGSGIVNIVGEHASYHLECNAPLTTDIEAIATPMSHWVRTSHSAADVARDGAAAITEARQPPGRIATLVLPADTAWNDGAAVAQAEAPAARRAPETASVADAARALTRGHPAALLLGDIAVREEALLLAGRIAAKTGCRILSEYALARLQRGAGRVTTERIPYAVDPALAMLKDVGELVLVGARVPVAFFAYPGKPGVLTAPGCQVTTLAASGDEQLAALQALAEHLGATSTRPAHLARLDRPGLPSGAITPEGIAAVLAALLPEHAIVVDESITTGRGFNPAMSAAAPHDWLNIVGGSIGWGLPAATGAAIAAPERTVIALEGDGSAMYTLQALWTMARESLNVKVLVFANRRYRILQGELANVGAGTPGRKADDMLSLDRPALDWVSLARGHGVDGQRADDLDGLAKCLSRALAAPGPSLIEVVI
ncbi:acetolactate synthase large subunit [Piscinibacter sakaiensis]|uniref:acetolactate synthase large subunit n=1 Tax=Piscinibacter sakaiensis TaxID=1547922 RepID=UPI003AAC45A4